MNTNTIVSETRSLCVIAREIRKDWGNKTSPDAKPYLDAMACMDSITDKYGCDDGVEIVIRFLCNASGWRGETAKRVKAELKKMVK
jgi:hypothetical protein